MSDPAAGASNSTARIGCAGWSIPRIHAQLFPGDGSHLQRYAGRFSCVEINSSFYRPHRRTTYSRWADSVPGEFRFAVKMPKQIKHLHRLVGTEDMVTEFLDQVAGLDGKLGPLLVQLPPSLEFDRAPVSAYFKFLREGFSGDVVCEPRHPTWFTPESETLLAELKIARAAADPSIVEQSAEPGGWQGIVYYRLHGSPRTYYSPYSDDFLAQLALKLRGNPSGGAWCIFDNTADGHATTDAMKLHSLVLQLGIV